MKDDAGFRSYEETVAEITGRWSVTDLIEQTDAELERADAMFYKAEIAPEAISQGQHPRLPIRWWRVRSGNTIYEVRRFRNFVWCSCRDFFFRKKMCKHAAVTVAVYCESCRTVSAKVGKLCYGCHTTQTMFLRPGAHERAEAA